MVESRPSYTLGVTFGASLMGGLIVLDLALLLLLLTGPVTFFTFLWGLVLFVSWPALVFIAYWTANLSKMRYHVAGSALIIEWGRSRQIVPLSRMITLLPGNSLAGIERFSGIRWPGCLVGYGYVKGVGSQTIDNSFYETLFYATEPLERQVLLVTESVAYGISPVDLENFTACIEALRLSPLSTEETAPPSQSNFQQWTIWGDRTAQALLATAICLNALLFASLCTLYGRLPARIPLHFDRFGRVDRMGSPAELFVLPLVGLLTWLVNGATGWLFYHWRGERVPAFLLWGGAIVVQLAAWGAVLGLLT